MSPVTPEIKAGVAVTLSLPEYPMMLPEPMGTVSLREAAARLVPLAACHSGSHQRTLLTSLVLPQSPRRLL